jgi:hypothetical protein
MSEAMIEGDSRRTREANRYLARLSSGEIIGCAIGAAILAAGGDVEKNGSDSTEFFPWLATQIEPPKGRTAWTYELEISRRFIDLMLYQGPSYEELVEYVRSVEPECTDCCQFQCTCKKSEQESCQLALA